MCIDIRKKKQKTREDIMASPLLGPPSLRGASGSATGNCGNGERPVMGLTENMSATFLNTGNPCLDFFFKVAPDTPSDRLIESLKKAWAFNPLMTLKLICNLRGVRGTGKSNKEGFYSAALWLHRNHPKTLAGNVKAIADFGYFKDFMELLYRILEGPTVREDQKAEYLSRKGKRRSKRLEIRKSKNLARRSYKRSRTRYNYDDEPAKKTTPKDNVKNTSLDPKSTSPKHIMTEKEEARALRKERERNKAEKALTMYKSDEDYRRLHDSVSSFFEQLLKADVEKLKSGKLHDLSLAAKWCPTIDSSYDKATLICESIARKVFPREKHPEYEGLEEPHYVYRVRDRLRKDVLVPLHKALELPEVYMSANKWNALPYNRVPSVAMTTYQKLFSSHDKERFGEYLEKVKSGKATIAAGALLPHKIIEAVQNVEERQVAELQWKRLVDDMKQKGTLSNCIAICDVSGSMSGIPMEVSVALGVLVSELSEEPWKGKLITFSSNPEIQEVKGDTLLEKTEFVRDMDWGMNTDFQAVFDRILEVAVKKKIKDENMVKRVFVFSDMEFDQASSKPVRPCRRSHYNSSYPGDYTSETDSEDSEDEWEETDYQDPWETDYQVIQRKYSEHGYTVPEIVFWNLRASRSIPVNGKQRGVALVSGFSKNMLKIFLNGGEVANPVAVMELAIAGEEYQKLAVFD